MLSTFCLIRIKQAFYIYIYIRYFTVKCSFYYMAEINFIKMLCSSPYGNNVMSLRSFIEAKESLKIAKSDLVFLFVFSFSFSSENLAKSASETSTKCREVAILYVQNRNDKMAGISVGSRETFPRKI